MPSTASYLLVALPPTFFFCSTQSLKRLRLFSFCALNFGSGSKLRFCGNVSDR
jgi:hypothetical protein